jgi:hypothetical protein
VAVLNELFLIGTILLNCLAARFQIQCGFLPGPGQGNAYK